ncbi:MAG: archease [Candidatus Binatia bacterium]
MPYRFLEDIATADIAFLAWGQTLEETFIAAADATMNVMIEELTSIRELEQRAIELSNDSLDMLLFNFLQELIYYKDAEQLLLRVKTVKIETPDEEHRLQSSASGEKLDPERHRQRVDVKAVTLHRFRLEKKDGFWEAEIILDI